MVTIRYVLNYYISTALSWVFSGVGWQADSRVLFFFFFYHCIISGAFFITQKE
jgi:hypothetical protein